MGKTRLEFKMILVCLGQCMKSGGGHWPGAKVALGDMSVKRQEGKANLGNRSKGDTTMGDRCSGKSSRMKNKKYVVWGMSGVCISQETITDTSQLQSGFSWSLGHLLIVQHMLRKMTRSQRNFIKIINGLQAEAKM